MARRIIPNGSVTRRRDKVLFSEKNYAAVRLVHFRELAQRDTQRLGLTRNDIGGLDEANRGAGLAVRHPAG
jgi:hypothetical protein